MFRRSKEKTDGSKTADVGLIIEGNYPYVSGGVAYWIHDMIKAYHDLTFHVVTIIPAGTKTKPRYEIPKNVLSVSNLFLQVLPPGGSAIKNEKQFFDNLERLLLRFFDGASLEDLRELINLFQPHTGALGVGNLMNSHKSWLMLKRMYEKKFLGGSFTDFFWSWRAIFGGLLSTLLHPLPPAKMYHSLSTGFAGLCAARAAVETKVPLLLTEHGIYTNERRIELNVAQWIHDLGESDLSLCASYPELKQLWFSVFSSASSITYQASDQIVSLFKENQLVQEHEGADPKKLHVIPNGIQLDKFSDSTLTKKKTRLTIALIGRVVPIKGIKTYLSACKMIKEEIPDLQALILGSLDEDPEYVLECKDLTKHLDLDDTVEFLDEVEVRDYFPSIDVLVLTSVSEAQPLVVLEAGAAGIPAVVTNVGSCKDLVYGSPEEMPHLGNGGAVVPVSDARSVAREVVRLLKDWPYRMRCGQALKSRVRKYYNSKAQLQSYKEIYHSLKQQPITAKPLAEVLWQG